MVSVLTLLLALGAAGCNRGDDPGVATGKTGAPKAGASASAGDGSGLKFSQCMRDQGLSWFPDPGPDGGLKVSVPEGTDQSTYDKAEQACKAFAPGSGQQGRPSEEDLAKIRQMSQCMREHGFAKYPDPDANGSITIDSRVLGVEPDDPAFQQALEDCRKFLPPRKNGGS